MIIGPPIVARCPACKGLVTRQNLISGNTCGGRLWTDGKGAYPMLPDAAPMGKCPHCGALAWIHQYREIGTIDDWPGGGKRVFTENILPWFARDPSEDTDESPDFSSARPLQSPTRDDYLSCLAAGVQDPEEERTLRLQVWWNDNDARRNGDTALAMDADAIANLERLATMMDERDDDDRLMKAEILRELGSFIEAEGILAKGFPRRLSQAAERIRTLNASHSSAVAELEQRIFEPIDFSDASPLLDPPFMESPDGKDASPPRRSFPRITLNTKQRRKIFKTLLHHRRSEYGVIHEFISRFMDALLYVALPPDGVDSKVEFSHRLDLLCRLFTQFYETYSARPLSASAERWRELHIETIIQLREDIRAGLIDLDRIDQETNAELRSSRGLSLSRPILITTRMVIDPEWKYSLLISHPAADCVVWLTRRLQTHWEACVPFDDGSQYLTSIAESASDYLTAANQSKGDPATRKLDRNALLCHVIDRLLTALDEEKGCLIGDV